MPMATRNPATSGLRFVKDGDDNFRLTVEDDGCGLTLGASPRGTGLGSKLIAAMARGLSTTVEYDRNFKGCRAVVVAPLT